MGEQLEANREPGLCAVCLRQACDGKSCDWALGAQQPRPVQLSALDRADISRELVAREQHLAELLARSVAHRSPGARRMLVARLARVRELLVLLAVLLLALAGCAEQPPPPYPVYFTASVPAADRAVWGAAANACNASMGTGGPLFVVGGETGDGGGVHIYGDDYLGDAWAVSYVRPERTVIRYEVGALQPCVALHELFHVLLGGNDDAHVADTVFADNGCDYEAKVTPELAERVRQMWGL